MKPLLSRLALHLQNIPLSQTSLEIIQHQQEEDREEMEIVHRLDTLLDSLPNNPQKIFAALGFPIDVVRVDALSGKGFQRTFEWNGTTYSRPELVAKAHYESMGYKVTWSEGVAFSFVLDAIAAEVADRIHHHFFIPAQKILSDVEIEKRIERGIPFMDRVIRNNEYLKQKPEALAAGGVRAAGILRTTFLALLHNDPDKAARQIANMSNIGLSLPIQEMVPLFQRTLEEVVLHASGDVLCRWLPLVSDFEHLEQYKKQNYNVYSLQFATELIHDFPREAIFSYISESESLNCPMFDLTLFKADTSEILFSEVKLDDKFTQPQLVDLQLAIRQGCHLRLAIITRPA